MMKSVLFKFGPLLLLTTMAAAAETGATAAPAVAAAAVKMVIGDEATRHVGVVESVNRVDIMPRVTGTLLALHFKEGETVNRGDLLYELEDTSYRTAVESLKAQKELLEAALKYADAEYKRNSSLLQSNAVSRSAHDKAELEIASAQAKLKDIDAAIENAENTLSYTKIHAPISGRIGKSSFTEGNLISPNGGKLTDIESVAPIYVRFSISERTFRHDFGGSAHIRENAEVSVMTADGALYPETAGIALIDNKVSMSSNTVTLWAEFNNADSQLLPGGFVTVLLARRTDRKYPAVSPSALIAGENGYSVYVLDENNTVEKRGVTCGRLSGDLQLIIAGLDGGERIIVDGMHKAVPGGKVIPVTEENAERSE
ncbi:MAG: efflux RND transporter periplasmic adaptor subunit [Victivallaceae bacterium]|nr:efflux RND transporter periplasmic adaptor subunit [Victivallaceae bacterium]